MFPAALGEAMVSILDHYVVWVTGLWVRGKPHVGHP